MTKEINRERRIGRVIVSFHWRAKDNLWGRFGGGWNWRLGFQASRSSIVFWFFIFSIGFSFLSKGVE